MKRIIIVLSMFISSCTSTEKIPDKKESVAQKWEVTKVDGGYFFAVHGKDYGWFKTMPGDSVWVGKMVDIINGTYSWKQRKHK